MWQPIETAPDGDEYSNSETFLAAVNGVVFPCQRRGDTYFDLESVDRDGDWWEVQPTHWMPLPNPPEAA